MPSGSLFVICFLACLFLSGCAANDLVVKRQAESEAKIEFLIQTVKKADQRSNEQAATLQTHDERMQGLSGELKQLREDNQALRSENRELAAKISGLHSRIQTPKVEVVNEQAAAKTSREAGPPEDYLKAFGLYSANNFPAAISAFNAFITANQTSEYAPNALYWIGECHYTLSELAKAKEIFSRVAEQYPKSSKVPDALLKLGYTLAALNDTADAKAVFEKITTAYPSSPAAAKARERLNAR